MNLRINFIDWNIINFSTNSDPNNQPTFKLVCLSKVNPLARSVLWLVMSLIWMLVAQFMLSSINLGRNTGTSWQAKFQTRSNKLMARNLVISFWQLALNTWRGNFQHNAAVQLSAAHSDRLKLGTSKIFLGKPSKSLYIPAAKRRFSQLKKENNLTNLFQ